MANALANRDPTGPITRPVMVDPSTGKAKLGGRATPLVSTSSQSVAKVVSVSAPLVSQESVPSESRKSSEPRAVLSDDEIKRRWPEVVAAQKPMSRALYSAVNIVDCKDGLITLAAPSDVHIAKSSEYLAALLASLLVVAGKPVKLNFVVSESKRAKNAKQNLRELIEEDIEDHVDLAETTKAPMGSHSTAMDDLAKAFPGSQIIDDKK